MARRKPFRPSAGTAAEFERRGVAVGGSAEPADDNLSICAMFGISKTSLKRWREERGFPGSDFTIGLREYTWRRRVLAWIELQPKTHPLKGRRLVGGSTKAA